MDAFSLSTQQFHKKLKHNDTETGESNCLTKHNQRLNNPKLKQMLIQSAVCVNSVLSPFF